MVLHPGGAMGVMEYEVKLSRRGYRRTIWSVSSSRFGNVACGVPVRA
jgi:hypothetical protein